MRRFLFVISLIIMFFVTSIMPLAAQASAITVTATWVSPVQLTTLDTGIAGAAYPHFDSGDDYRYVDLQFKVTTNVQFWAVDLTCTFNGNVLSTYTQDTAGGTPDNNMDNQIPMQWSIMNGGIVVERITATGASLTINHAISQLNGAAPVGQHGVTSTIDLGVRRFLVKPTGATPTVPGTSTVICTPSFLDRSGRVVVPAVFVPPSTALSILTGHTISGKLGYQGRATVAGIGVDCAVNGTHFTTTTDTTGKFKVNVRPAGMATCKFFGNLTNAAVGYQNDYHLAINAMVDLKQSGISYTFLPHELPGGNVSFDTTSTRCGGSQCIDDFDIAQVTQHWLTDTQGDANGDGKTDKSDLAIVTSQYGTRDSSQRDHGLYGVATTMNPTRTSRIYLGSPDAGQLTLWVPAAPNTSDLWPRLSPDGSTIAFIRKTIGATPQLSKYELYKVSAAGGAVTPVAVLTKTQANNLDAFAPSWSPDGSRIAFVCSPGYGDTSNTSAAMYTGYGTNAGYLCVVDASGGNFRVLTSGALMTKISPPAWDGTWLIYSATGTNPICYGDLCVYDLSNDNHFWLDIDVLGTSGDAYGADMPMMVNGVLYYIWNGSPSYGNRLEMIDGIDKSCPGGVCDYVKAFQPVRQACAGQPGNDAAAPRPFFLHTRVDFRKPDCSTAPVVAGLEQGFLKEVDFYEVSPYGMHLMLYGRTSYPNIFLNAIYGSGVDDTVNGPCASNPTDGDSNKCFPEWQNLPPNGRSVKHTGDNMVGNWSWTGDREDHTLLHAERDTVDWTP